MKAIDSGIDLVQDTIQKPLTSVSQLPTITYCEKIPPPSQDFVIGVLLDLYVEKESGFDHLGLSYEGKLLSAAGIKWETMTSEEIKTHYPEVREYWNKYCYSYSYKKSIGDVCNDRKTLIDVKGDNFAFNFIGRICGANINYLNPFSGKTYLDVIYEDLIRYSLAPDDFQSKVELLLSRISKAKKYGAKNSEEMIYEYMYNPIQHNELIEAIVCNSKGEGILSNLENNPEEYFYTLYKIGLRNFDEAVFLFEKTNNLKLSDSKKVLLKKTLLELKPVWN